MGLYKIQLVDETSYQHVIERLEAGFPVKLLADPENPQDPRAVKAMYKGETIGYVEQDSWLIRAMHDDRTPVASRIDQIIADGPGDVRSVVLDVRTGVDAEAALSGSKSNASDPVPVKAKKGCAFWALIVVTLIVGLAVIGALFGPTKEQIAAQKVQKTAEVAESATDVTADELWAAYDQNEASAQQAYGNRPLRITGTIDGVQLGISDEPFITLKTGNMFQSVQLHLADPSDPTIAALRKGNKVTAVCTGISEVVGTPILKDCALQ